MGRKIKLFGFELTMTSALLLFIFAIGLILVGMNWLYLTITDYNETEDFPVMMFFLAMILLIFGAYVLIQTVRFRR